MVNRALGKTILVVEDCQATLNSQKAMFEEAGFKVVGTVKSGLEAIAMAGNLSPDYISLDIIMPEMDGIECFFRMKESGVRSKMFFVPALSSESRVVQAYAGEIPEGYFLAKPLTLDAIQKFLSLGDEVPSPAHELPPLPDLSV